MELSFKPNLDEALRYWRAFWNKEIIDRPAISIVAPKDGVEPVPGPPWQGRPDLDFRQIAAQAEEAFSRTYFAGESMPHYSPSFGPDQLAAFVGARLDMSPDSSGTTWSVPFVESWEEALPLELGKGTDLWDRMLGFYRAVAERAKGKFVVGTMDMHSNFDWLAAIRRPDRLCMDLLDEPALIHRAMNNVRDLFTRLYEALYDAGDMAASGTAGWLPYYCEGRYATVQCDFCLLLSPGQFREFVLPALQAECEYLDHSVYHYDGPEALTHLDAITGIEALDGIQWTPGARNKPFIEWIDLLKKFQSKGKNVIVGCANLDELKFYHRELKPELVFYCMGVGSQKEADDIIKWLKANT